MTGQLWWEDFTVGKSFEMGTCTVDRAEVIAFAQRFDPQPFHLDDEAAARNPIFGRLSASGVHTFALASRLMHDGCIEHGIVQVAGGGVDELRFVKPVFPGDTLRLRAEVVDRRELKSRKDIAVVKMRSIVRNQHDDVVMDYIGNLFYERRPTANDPARP